MSVSDKKSILVIDDDITIRKLISHHLNLHNYKVYLASNTDEGFDQLYNNNIDLVLCDIIMDKMDGFTFCQLVRENENYRSLPFVFVTAKNTLEDKSRALEAGGDDFITKPFNVDEMILKVKALIRRTEINRIYGTRKNLREVFTKRTPKVIIVDDDKSALTIYQSWLHKAGIECQVAYNAAEGLKLAKSFQPDLIVADIMMPEIDGFKFREMLLQDSELASIPFIFLSNISSEQEILDGFNKDITDYILKDRGHKIITAKISALLKSLSKERRKVVTELHEASEILKTSVVPEVLPDFDNFDIRYWHIPFTGIPGGDFIDHFLLDGDHLTIVLGDVMGKKWGAWYFAYAYAGYIRSAIHSVIEEGDVSSPGKIIGKVNKLVYKDSKISEVFSTLSVVVIDKKNMSLKYSGAGDMPIIYRSKSAGELKRIDSKGLLLGFNKDAVFDDADLQMNPNDTVIMTTDGMIESRDAEGNQFGVSKLIKTILKDDFIKSPIDVLRDDINNFNQLKFDDDVSVITIAAK
ncbi:MAG: response regulator [Ignavibacteriaceae bacterium]|nr:response regulator [Ignavibacteriaceae bacterium]